jgi:hypothetical protein
LSDASADALGHAAFAAHLASVIATLSPKDGITVGLYGDPGGGRTTALNLTRAALREHPAAAKWTVVDWNPWLLSGGADWSSGSCSCCIGGAWVKLRPASRPHADPALRARWPRRSAPATSAWWC